MRKNEEPKLLNVLKAMELEFELPDEWFFDGGDEAGEYMKFIRWVLGSREGELQDDILR